VVCGYEVSWLWRVAVALHVSCWFFMGKVRLFVRARKQGCRIESVPLKRLLKLSGYRKRRWEFRDGWLILEAF
jgi:hypothetical protein